jgi:hypothetical protein
MDQPKVKQTNQGSTGISGKETSVPRNMTAELDEIGNMAFVNPNRIYHGKVNVWDSMMGVLLGSIFTGKTGSNSWGISSSGITKL